MKTTPIAALPYPEGTDRLMDGDDAIKALALALDHLVVAGPWNNMALGAGWLAYGAPFLQPQWRLIGDTVQVRGMVKAGAKATPITTFPAGARPPLPQQFATLSDGAFAYLQVDGAGLLSHMGGSNGSLSLNFSFPVS